MEIIQRGIFHYVAVFHVVFVMGVHLNFLDALLSQFNESFLAFSKIKNKKIATT